MFGRFLLRGTQAGPNPIALGESWDKHIYYTSLMYCFSVVLTNISTFYTFPHILSATVKNFLRGNYCASCLWFWICSHVKSWRIMTVTKVCSLIRYLILIQSVMQQPHPQKRSAPAVTCFSAAIFWWSHSTAAKITLTYEDQLYWML